MNYRLTALTLALLSFGALPCQGATILNPKGRSIVSHQKAPKIRVLIAKEIPSALLEVRGDYKVVRQDTGGLLSFGRAGKRFVVHGMKEGLRWGEEYPDVFAISILPQSAASVCYINGIQYKGAVSVTQNANNRITVVNEVPLEDFIKSTLAYRVEAPLSKEVMAALAITARTEAHFLSQMHSANEKWDVIAEEVNYYGHGVTMRGNKVGEACDNTQHMVMAQLPDVDPQGSTFAAKWTTDRVKHSAQKLSVLGAEEMACRGYNAKRILKSYFPKTEISTLSTPSPIIRR